MIEARKTDPTMPVMGMWTISPIGVPSAIAGIAFVLLVSARLLPSRKSVGTRVTDPREYTVEMLVVPNSAIDGLTIEAAGLRHLPGVYLSAIERNGEALPAVGPDQVLRGDDQLIFVGIVDSVVDLHRMRGLVPATKQVFKLNDPRPQRCLVEAVVSNTCPIVGQSIREGEFRTRYDAAVIAVHRTGGFCGVTGAAAISF
jgi:K+/H+ antiporter YhaU regulatory subunit KhtT